MTRHPFIGVLFFLELLSLRAFPGSIAGRVMSESDHEGVAGVRVFLQGTVRGVSTGAQGEFRLAEISPGTYTLVFSMIGYQRLTVVGVVVRDTGETVLTVKMIQVPIETDQIVVTANKREQSLDEVPASISVVDATAIERRNAQSIDEVLRYVPGVNITGTQVNIRGFSGYSLGAGSRVLMLLDGIPFIAGDTGELNFESVPMEEVERVEVVKGASSSISLRNRSRREKRPPCGCTEDSTAISPTLNGSGPTTRGTRQENLSPMSIARGTSGSRCMHRTSRMTATGRTTITVATACFCD